MRKRRKRRERHKHYIPASPAALRRCRTGETVKVMVHSAFTMRMDSMAAWREETIWGMPFCEEERGGGKNRCEERENI